MFKESFKYYKSKKDHPDLATVIDLDQPSTPPLATIRPLPGAPSLPLRPDCRPPTEWRCFQLADRPGLLIVRNPFTATGQRYWMARCLRDYPRHPHATNLPASPAIAEAAGRDWWAALQREPDTGKRRKLRGAMRWATLGYHHNWDTKEYSEAARYPFPGDLGQLSAYVAEVLGFGGEYEAQAAIVNFYPQGTTLAGHTDHSERELEAPLFSFSFGQSAIFLIGGPTADQQPSAVFLRSGDIAVMSRQSRLSYHAVPRILHGASDRPWQPEPVAQSLAEPSDSGEPIEPHAKRKKQQHQPEEAEVLLASLAECSLDADLWRAVQVATEWRPFADYVTDCRININVRRVLPSGVTALDDVPASRETRESAKADVIEDSK